jgi:SAM-dependent methyltransferase
MNEKEHWNTIAGRYNTEIFDVFQSDKKKILPVYFNKHRKLSGSALDAGCGIGKAFSFLSPRFRSVFATDISDQCLKEAKTSGYPNITFQQGDLTRKNLKLPLSDFAFCCNVVMLPELDKNFIMLENIRRGLKKNGTAVFVLPSTESIFFATSRLTDWYRLERVSAADIPSSELSYYSGNKRSIIHGVMKINGVLTKHYLEQELEVMFRSVGFEVTTIDKVEYEWDTEFASPPEWMKAPYPWDWLVECRNPF